MDNASGRLADRYLAMVVDDSPTFATFLGLHANDASLGDLSAEAAEDRRTRRAELLVDVEGAVQSSASLDERIDLEVLRGILKRHVFEHDVLATHRRDPGLYIGTALFGCNQLLMRDFAPLEERAGSLLGRLRGVPEVLSACERNVVSPPSLFASAAADMARRGSVFLEETVAAVAAQVPALATELERAVAAASSSLSSSADHLESLAEDAGPSFSVGRSAYEWLLRESHLLDLDSDGLLETGRRSLARTKSDMEEVARRIDPSRDWREVVEALKDEHPRREGLRAFYASQMERAREFVVSHEIARVPDGEVLDVVDTPEYLRALLPYAAYGPAGPFEAEQKGFFYVTPIPDGASAEEAERQLRGHSVHNIAIIALHEGYPGHHLQLVSANLVPGTARKLARNNVFIEGWALYCEEMMWESGFWDDDRTRLFQLNAALWRGARVVVDVGLQRGEMSFEEAVDFMVDEAGLVRVQAEAEVTRYAANPTQPSSYLIGKRAIADIRDRFEKAQGSAFSVRGFHDRLLAIGSVPPRLAEAALGLTDGTEPGLVP